MSIKEKYDQQRHNVYIKADTAFDEYKRLKSEKEYFKTKSILEDAVKQ